MRLCDKLGILRILRNSSSNKVYMGKESITSKKYLKYLNYLKAIMTTLFFVHFLINSYLGVGRE